MKAAQRQLLCLKATLETFAQSIGLELTIVNQGWYPEYVTKES
jgi:hypothetical protein